MNSGQGSCQSSCRFKDDHPDSLLHLWKGDREQMGGLPGTAPSRVYRGVKKLYI